MALFSSNFSFAAPSSRPEHLYPLSAPLSDSISPTSSRAASPSSPTSTVPSSVSSSTDDLFALTSHLSASSLYPSSCTNPRSMPPLGGRRSPPRSNPFGLPPTSGPSTDLFARRERRQAYVQDQLSSSGRRKLSLLVARMLGDEVTGEMMGAMGARKHPNDGLHPSNVRVVAAVPACVRRNTLAEVQGGSGLEEGDADVDGDAMIDDDEVVESIEERGGVVGGIGRESANRISKRRSAGRTAGRGRR